MTSAHTRLARPAPAGRAAQHRFDVSVVIPTYRRLDELIRLIDALGAQDTACSWEVVVVDDCSGSDTTDALPSLADRVPVPLRVLSTPVNSGPAVARNIGWQAADASLLAFLDDDVVPHPGWLSAGLESFRQDPTLGVAQGRTEPPAGVDLQAMPLWSAWRDILQPGPYFQGCNIFYRRDALEAVGGFDEDIGWWGEDTTVGWKVMERGWGRGWSPGAVVTHDVEWRGPRWYARMGLKETNLVLLAARHPGFRREAFWRPFAYRRRDAAFVVAVLAAVMAASWRPAAAGVAPYLWLGRPSIRRPQFLRHCLETLLVDAARTAGHLSGAVRHRAAVL